MLFKDLVFESRKRLWRCDGNGLIGYSIKIVTLGLRYAHWDLSVNDGLFIILRPSVAVRNISSSVFILVLLITLSEALYLVTLYGSTYF